MQMRDEIRLEASQEVVWEALNNPDVLKACIPGCQTLEMISDTEFASLVVVKVGPIKAKFAGKVTLSDVVAPTRYRLTGEGQGGVAGFAKADIDVELVAEGPLVTLLRYGVNANIGGKIAQLGTRLIDATARKMADQFFARFNEQVQPVQPADASFNEKGGHAAAEVAAALSAVPADASVTATASIADVQHGAPAIDVARATADLVSNQYIVVNLVDVGGEAGMDAHSSIAGNYGGGVGKMLARLFGPGGTQASVSARAAEQPKYKAAIVTLNRPQQRNAISLAMWQNLGRIFTELGRDPHIRAIILTGAGGHFSAGADIAEFATVRATVEQGVAYEVAVDACCDAIAATSKPTIAVINGFCMGGACNLAMSCDFRFAHPAAQFGIPAARLSIVYGVRGTQRLMSLVGIANAKRILYGAQKFDAEEGQHLGFIDRVAQEPIRSAKAFAGIMAGNAPLTIAGTKILLNGLSMGLGVLDDAAINDAVERAVGSDDYRNARQAFVSKRQPVFKGT